MTPHTQAPRPAAGADRALAHCHELARVSSLPGGIERVHLSAEHKVANALVAAWMTEVGLDAWQDAAGNQCGRLEGREPGLPALVLGSHLDTVTDAGAYDGMLGVMLALEVVDRIRASGRRLPFALEVVGFTDEEGTRFGTALLGSRAFAGTWDADWRDLADRKGVTLADAARGFGLDPDRIATAARRPEELVGYLETHIEQGPYLLDADKPLAVVSSIAGARRLALTVTGRAGHAGGTPYERRRDALVGASEIVVEIERIAKRTGTVATVGRIRAFPGGVNVVPGVARFSLDLRAESDAARDAAYEEIEAFAREVCTRRGLAWRADEFYRADAVTPDPALRAAIEEGIRSTGDAEPLVLWSRAGHDGMAVNAVTGFAMLFLRCGNDGVSHHPDETVDPADVAVALDAFEAAVLALADAHDRRMGSATASDAPTESELRDRLVAALGVARWVDEMAAYAPYESLDSLVVLGRRTATPLSDDELDEAVAHHPRIGQRPQGAGTAARLSSGEQGALGDSDEAVDAAIAEGNARYEERFGRVFLIRAAGRSRPEVLTELQRRLGSDPAVEAEEAKEQLRQIMELRLRTLFADGEALS